MKKDHLAQVNLWAPFLYSERDTIIILVLDLCQRNFSCSNFRFSTKVVNWVIFHGMLWFGWCHHKRAQSLVSALVSSYLSPRYHESNVYSVPRVLRSLRIPDTADLYSCSLWANTTFVPNHQRRPGEHEVEDASWVCLNDSVPEPLLSHTHPSSLSEGEFCLPPSDCVLTVRCVYFCARSYSLMHWFYFKIHLYTFILSIKAFQKLSWNFSLSCLVSKILSEKTTLRSLSSL